ncbi:MAG TPA: type I restriction enzyme HsdR N-terminal domain-containing protein [Prolixibacteraceae bacterium]|nr:type I restriction enzyme HsdR N-terminal domain-containing protein [Prolixibacteraceae bacterium]HPR59765.1 type I restriction enzyme HsdR N-terminal domain-containing protein [Prolixibacteraceae bacterium]
MNEKLKTYMDFNFQQLNFPFSKFKIEERNGKLFIFDDARKRFVALTPEEWVRQNCLHFLRDHKKFPIGLMAVEKGIKINNQNLRYDIVAYSKKASPILLVECKAPEVTITQATFDQIAVYNISLKVPYLMVTNGLNHYFCQVDFVQKRFQFINDIPEFGVIYAQF